MRQSQFFSIVAGAGSALLALGAHATPIHAFNLTQASGQTSYTYSWSFGDPISESLTLSGWEWNGGSWSAADMIYKNGGAGETGLGVVCSQTPAGNSCGQHEIGTTPWQMIAIGLNGLSHYNALTIGAASVNTDNSANGKETAYLYGASCTPGGGCTPTLLDSYTYTGGIDTVSWKFSLTNLAPYSDLWLTPNAWDTTPNNNGNVLLWGGPNGNGFSVSVVPEPSVLGIFGLGLLMVGLLLGIRRRRA